MDDYNFQRLLALEPTIQDLIGTLVNVFALHHTSHRVSRVMSATLALVAGQLTILAIARHAHAQTPSFFGDTLSASSVTTTYGNNGTYTATSPVQSTSTITTFASATSGVGNYDGGAYAGTSHTWTSINQDYVPTGMTGPSSSANPNFGSTFSQTNASFDENRADILNSDGKSLAPADIGGSEPGTRFDQFLYTSFVNAQPYSTTNPNIYGMQMVWLVSPLITIRNGSVLQFWTIGAAGLPSVDTAGIAKGDELKLLFSSSSASTFNIGGYTNGNSTAGTATYDNGDFQKTLIDINPAQLVDGSGTVSTGTSTASGSFPIKWTAYNITISGLPTNASNPGGIETGRFAFQYIVSQANVDGNIGSGESIGIDNFSCNLPEPGSVALLALAGMPVVGMIARRRGRMS